MTNKEQIQKEIDQCKGNLERLENLLKEEDKKLSAREWIMNFLSQELKVKFTKGYITYYLGDQWIFNVDIKNKYLWVYYYQIRSFLEKEYSLKDYEIQELIQDTVGEALNCKEYTPSSLKLKQTYLVGEALNCKPN